MIQCTFENNNKASLRHAVVDVLVLKENKLLLVKRAAGILEAGKWALVGGYVERDENLQEAVAREIFEETGYRVEDITLLTVNHNPDRPHEDRQNISFVFFCQALVKEGESDWEVVDQQWFGFDELPEEKTIAFDHAKNIKLYLSYKKDRLTLPILT